MVDSGAGDDGCMDIGSGDGDEDAGDVLDVGDVGIGVVMDVGVEDDVGDCGGVNGGGEKGMKLV